MVSQGNYCPSELGELPAEVFWSSPMRNAKGSPASDHLTIDSQLAFETGAPQRAPVLRSLGWLKLETRNSTLPLNSLLIPCFGALESRKPSIHAAFRKPQKKFPVIFPVTREFG